MKLQYLVVFVLLAVPSSMAKKDEKEEAAMIKDMNRGKLLAKAKLKDNSVVDFYESEPGVILVHGKFAGKEGVKEFKEKKEKKEEKDTKGMEVKKEKDNPAKLYKRLTGKQSKELEEAWERAKVIAANADPEKEEQPEPEAVREPDVDDTIGGRRQLRAGGRQLEDWNWIHYYCSTWPQNPPTFCRCETQRTCSTQEEIYGFTTTAENIGVWLSPYRGGLAHKVYKWTCTKMCSSSCIFGFCWTVGCLESCTWEKFASDYVTSSEQPSYIGSYNARKYKWKFNTYLGSGDGWNYSVWADNSDKTSTWYPLNTYTCPNVY